MKFLRIYDDSYFCFFLISQTIDEHHHNFEKYCGGVFSNPCATIVSTTAFLVQNKCQ